MLNLVDMQSVFEFAYLSGDFLKTARHFGPKSFLGIIDALGNVAYAAIGIDHCGCRNDDCNCNRNDLSVS